MTDADYSPSPERIRADQREAIAAAVRQLGGSASVAAVADEVVLSPWTVRQRAAECAELFGVDGEVLTLRNEGDR